MHRRGDSSEGVFIVKQCHRGSDEVEILKYLRSVKPSSPHIITLVETVTTNVGEYLIFPERGSVDEQLTFFADGGRLCGHFPQLSLDLLMGLLFLHGLNIAHLDINPRNLLYTRDVRLQITDFDIAVRLRSNDDKIDDFRGTKGYMAPEIGKEAYSPIDADKWSTGCVLFIFSKRLGKPDDGMEAFAKQLMDKDPHRRPSLRAWPSASNQNPKNHQQTRFYSRNFPSL